MTRKEAIEHGKKQLEIFGGDHRKFIEIAIKELEDAEKLAEFREKVQEALIKTGALRIIDNDDRFFDTAESEDKE